MIINFLYLIGAILFPVNLENIEGVNFDKNKTLTFHL